MAPGAMRASRISKTERQHPLRLLRPKLLVTRHVSSLVYVPRQNRGRGQRGGISFLNDQRELPDSF